MKKIINNIFLFMGMIAIMTSCNDDDPEVSRAGEVITYDLAAAIAADISEDYTILARAIEHAGLASEISQLSSATIFAPTNNAFNGLFKDLGVAKVTDIDATVLANILKYHVVNGQLLSSDDLSGASMLLTSLQGGSLYVSGTINGKATFRAVDRQATNGVFHGISRVLSIPGTQNIVDLLSGMDEFDTLVAAITKAGLATTLSGSDLFTVQAPTNAAFAAAGVSVDGSTSKELEEVLLYHVFAGRILTTEFATGSKASLLGSLEGNNVQEVFVNATFTVPSFNGVAPDSLNILATNGVINRVGTLVQPAVTLNDAFGPEADLTFGNDGLGITQFGETATNAGFVDFDILKNFYTVLVPLFSGTITDPALAEAFVKSHTFSGDIQLDGLASSSAKITAIDGTSSYFVTNEVDGFRLNGSGSNSFGATSEFSAETFNGRIYYVSNFPAALTEDNFSKVLEDNGYSLFAAAVNKTGTLTGDGLTVFAVTDAVFSAFTGLTTVASIDALDAAVAADKAIIDNLTELVQTQTVTNVYYPIDLDGLLPELTNQLGEAFTLNFDGTYFIPLAGADLTVRSTVNLNSSLESNNGLIYEVTGIFDF